MQSTTTTVPPRVVPAVALRKNTLDKIDAVAATATDEETAAVQKIVDTATGGDTSSCSIHELTPGMSALIFTKHNAFNRAWTADKVVEYGRRMSAGLWEYNGEGLSFYISGQVADGQHRLGGSALSGYTITAPIAFGVKTRVVTTIDDGSARKGSDHAAMEGVKNAKRKESIVRTAANYLSKLTEPFPFPAVKSAAELTDALKKYDATLDTAIELGDGSVINMALPCLPPSSATRVAFILLLGGWPVQKIAHTLNRLQVGVAEEADGGKESPLYAVSQLIVSKTKGEVIAAIKQIGWIVNAALKYEAGAVASTRVLKAEVEKELPSPAFVPAATAQAAE
jgi:hypothetical protein